MNRPYAELYRPNIHGQQLEMERYGMGIVEDSNDMFPFLNDIGLVNKEISEYENIIDRINNLQKRILTTVQLEQIDDLNHQITNLTLKNNDLSKSIKEKIQILLNTAQNNPNKLAQVQSIKVEFKKSVQRYLKVEESYRKKYRENLKRQFSTACPDADEKTVDNVASEMLENRSGGSQMFAQALVKRADPAQAQAVMAEVQVRHESILKLAQTIEELAQLFQDLENMVAEQDSKVLVVENNVEIAQKDLEYGVGDLGTAVTTAKKIRRKKWKLLGLFIAIILVFSAAVIGGVCGSGKCSSSK
ncbi:uncharacterized protein SAPINGB_P003626 [Magnusiomyces paraingens]|uniref:t-SNARE coiled-coil homology domain-containing protein n=1 Tax=Magnusiomyces paraingens TaxID=2606893 RepID=A0A5E8BR70_9ASCO|nr:uncharacterized protein SAPINGB_P003626 [Saprochaete ingens]VVT53541.1 unnamed protein product [Saprochaete ingens]